MSDNICIKSHFHFGRHMTGSIHIGRPDSNGFFSFDEVFSYDSRLDIEVESCGSVAMIVGATDALLKNLRDVGEDEDCSHSLKTNVRILKRKYLEYQVYLIAGRVREMQALAMDMLEIMTLLSNVTHY